VPPPTAAELDLDRATPSLVGGRLGPDHPELGAHTHQRLVTRHPVRRAGGRPLHRLEQVGLALGVGTDEHAHARLEVDRDVPVGADIDQLQASQPHRGTLVS
jgi:hypothetical protein